MTTRRERVNETNERIEKEWHNKWWSFMMKYEHKLVDYRGYRQTLI